MGFHFDFSDVHFDFSTANALKRLVSALNRSRPCALPGKLLEPLRTLADWAEIRALPVRKGTNGATIACPFTDHAI